MKRPNKPHPRKGEQRFGRNQMAGEDRFMVPTIEQCRSYASEYKKIGKDPGNSARRSAVLLGVSRSWTTLAHQLEALAVIVKDEANE
jgi:hypothetical protein